MVLQLEEAILHRRSTRHFKKKHIWAESIQELLEFKNNIITLDTERIDYKCFENPKIIHALLNQNADIYGKFINPPCILIPSIARSEGSPVHFGFQVEQLVLQLTDMGFASCWISVEEDEWIKKLVSLPTHQYIYGMVVFGYEDMSFKGTLMNINIRELANSRVSDEDFVFKGNFDQPLPLDTLPLEIQKAIQLSILSSSRHNQKPWKLILYEGTLYCIGETQCPMEAGIFLSHFTLTLLHERYRFGVNFIPTLHREKWSRLFDLSEEQIPYGLVRL